MAITVDGAASDPTTTTTDVDISVTAPGGTGGRLYAIGYCTDSRTISPPGGWTEVFNNAGDSMRTYLWMRADDAAGSYAFTVSGTFNNAVVGMLRVGGASTNTPSYTHSTGSNDTSQTCPSLTSPGAGSLYIWVVAYGADNGPCTADKGTEQIDVENATSGTMLYVVTNVEAGTGSITGATVTSTGFGAKRLISIAIEPDGGGGGGSTATTSFWVA